MTNRRAAFVVLAVVASGCSIFNAPDVDFLDTPPPIPDLGPGPDVRDMSTEQPDVADMLVPDAGDAGPDAADMFMPPESEVCNDGADNDGDRFVDCADTDCFSDYTSCCGGRATTTHVYPFDVEGVSSDDWVPSPATASAMPAGAAVESVQNGAMLLRARGGSSPECVPMDSGVRLELVLSMRDGPATGGTLGVTLTRARQSGGSEPLPAELRIAVHDGRRVVVEQAGIERTSMVVEGTDEVTVVVELTPSVTPIGTAGLLARVSSTPIELPAPSSPIYVEHLVQSETTGATTQPCVLDSISGAGLYVALEGRPTDARLRSLTLQPASCVSPSVWTRERDLRNDTTLTTEASAIGDVGFLRANPMTSSDWYVVADVTNGDPDAEDVLFVPWALSLLYSSGGAVYERPRDPATMLPFNDEIVGNLCTPGSCGMHRSNREAEMALSTSTSYLLFAFACERAMYGEYDVCFGQQRRSDTTGRLLAPITFLPALPTSQSFRSPAIAARDETSVDGLLTHTVRLFAVSEAMGVAPSVVSATVEITDNGEGTRAASLVGDFVTLFDADDLGAIARKGIRSLSVLFEPAADGLSEGVYRLWFVSEAPGEATISHAVASFGLDGTPSAELYGANPIMRAGAGGLSMCRDMDGEGCKIRGLSVTHDRGPAGAPGRLVMLVSYDEPALLQSSRLITLFQPFRGGT